MFRVLLAEIVAELICRRAVREEARTRPADYSLGAEIHVLADEMFVQMHRRFSQLVTLAHRVMLDDLEVARLQEFDKARLPGSSNTLDTDR